MPRKRTLGSNVLRRAIPSKVEITLKPPYPLDIVQLRIQWESEENRKLSDREFQYRLKKYIKLLEKNEKKKRKRKVPRQTAYV